MKEVEAGGGGGRGLRQYGRVRPARADTSRNSNAAFQPRRFTSYERDANGSDEAMFRRYNRSQARFEQADPYDGSYDLTDPQSFNRYAYVRNDPVNFTDPTGLIDQICWDVGGDPWFGGGEGWFTTCVYAPDPWGGYSPADRPVGGEDGETPPQTEPPAQQEEDACTAMAEAAQRIANAALDFWGNTKDALLAFDQGFSYHYLRNNGLGDTFWDAVEFHNSLGLNPNARYGDDGFRQEFRDGEGDQTHHYVAFQSAGINNQWVASSLHQITDTFNRADIKLGTAAYKIGADLRRDPRNLFSIGERVLKEICGRE